jgi:THO complex subunit 2
MCSFTENEAHRYGRFLNSIFEDIMRWHGDKAVFEKVRVIEIIVCNM